MPDTPTRFSRAQHGRDKLYSQYIGFFDGWQAQTKSKGPNLYAYTIPPGIGGDSL